MTQQQALEIPDLQIQLTDIVEDCFFYKMFLLGRLSVTEGVKTEDRLRHKYTQQELEEALATADRMVDNIDKYGVPSVYMM